MLLGVSYSAWSQRVAPPGDNIGVDNYIRGEHAKT